MYNNDIQTANADIDVIIVNYNSSDYIIRCIDSLYQSNNECYNLNIIIIDNHSQDSPNRIAAHNRQIIIKFNRTNIGFGAAVNQGLKYCCSEYVVLLNPDSRITKGFLEACIEFMDRRPNVGIMGPLIVDKDGSVQGSARSFPTPLTSLFGRNSPITKLFPNNSITRSNILTWSSQDKKARVVDWVSGACMVVRRKAIQDVGGFDERFFLYWEDTDLCHRVREAGWKVVYYPFPKVMHFVGKSSNTRPIFANYQFHKSCFRLYQKYTKWPLSILTPVAGMALMYRFLVVVFFNRTSRVFMKANKARVEYARRTLKKRDSRIRILRVISRMNIGGPAIHVKNITENLNYKKYQTLLVSGDIPSNEGNMEYIIDQKKVNWMIIPELCREISPINDILTLLKLIRVTIAFNPHIIDSHTSKAGGQARIAAAFCNFFRKGKIVTVHTFHGNVFEGYFSKAKSLFFLLIERLLAKITDQIIAISASQRNELLNIYKIDRQEKIATINLGFDLTPFVHSRRLKGILRKKIGIGFNTILIGIVGRLAPIKNHYLFFDAAKLFIDAMRYQQVKFIAIGGGELRAPLENYTRQIGIADKVIFYGWEKNIPMVYADLDIVALTSINEGTPVSIIEAMAASVPVITTEVGGINDLLGKENIQESLPHQRFKVCERGILCPKDDPLAFAEGFDFIIKTEYAHRLENARQFVLQNYTTEKLTNKMDKLYSTLLHRHKTLSV